MQRVQCVLFQVAAAKVRQTTPMKAVVAGRLADVTSAQSDAITVRVVVRCLDVAFDQRTLPCVGRLVSGQTVSSKTVSGQTVSGQTVSCHAVSGQTVSD